MSRTHSPDAFAVRILVGGLVLCFLGLSPRALAGQSGALDPSILEEGARSYAYLVDDTTLGRVEYRLARDGPDWVSTVTIDAGGGVQETELRFDARDFAPRALRQTRSDGPARIAMQLEVDDGVVRGRVELPARFGAPREFDESLPPGTLLPGMEEYALALADLHDGAVLRISYFDVTAGEIVKLEARVSGTESIELASGEHHEVWRVELQGTAAPTTLFLERASPHLIVSQHFEGQPVRLERITPEEGSPNGG